MRGHLRRAWPALVFVLGLAACGSEGGVVGSGISTATIAGNVVAVQESLIARAGVPRLEVRLEEVDAETETNDVGGFELSGDFAGPLTLRFSTLGGRVLARLPLDVPAGSLLELEDLEIGPQIPGGVRPHEVRQRNVVGRVVQVNCEVPGFLLRDDRGRPFRVLLDDETEIVLRATGEPGTCADMAVGSFVRVEGTLRMTDAGPLLEAAEVTVSADRPPRAGPRR